MKVSHPAETVKAAPGGSFVRASDLSGSRSAVKTALSRAAASGALVRLRRGVYYKPVQTRFGPIKPAAHELLREVLGPDAGFGPTGFTAAHRLGMTTQVPATEQYVTVRPVPTALPPRVAVSRRNNVLRAQLTEQEVGFLELLQGWMGLVEGGWPVLAERFRDLVAHGVIRVDELDRVIAAEQRPATRDSWHRLKVPPKSSIRRTLADSMVDRVDPGA